MKKKVRKPRKPKNFELKTRYEGLPYTLEFDASDLPSKYAREFAAWLVRAAEYVESREQP